MLVNAFEVSMELIGQAKFSSNKVQGIADKKAFH